MILVTVALHVPADKREDALATAAAARAETLKEDGCLEYRLWTASDDPNALLVFERWRDADALSAHMGAPHVATLQAAMGGLVEGPPELTTYEVPDPE